jgi:hypothetical protein
MEEVDGILGLQIPAIHLPSENTRGIVHMIQPLRIPQ